MILLFAPVCQFWRGHRHGEVELQGFRSVIMFADPDSAFKINTDPVLYQDTESGTLRTFLTAFKDYLTLSSFDF